MRTQFRIEKLINETNISIVNGIPFTLAQIAQSNATPAFRTDDIPALLLITLLIKVLILGGLIVTMLVFIVRQRKIARQIHEPSESLFHAAHGVMFETPSCWLAIQSKDLQLIQKTLCLRNTKPCAWDDGLHSENDHQLFVSPPIHGWTLVFGPDLIRFSTNPDACFHFIRNLSKQLGVVQFFSANRALNHHGWVLANRGDVLRAYSWAGETAWNQGVMTAAEKDLGMTCFDYGTESTLEDSNAEALFSNTEKVHKLAAKWSVDPTSVTLKPWMRKTGFVGEF